MVLLRLLKKKLCIFFTDALSLEGKFKDGKELATVTHPFHKYIASISYDYDYNLICVATVISVNQLLTLAQCIKTPIIKDSVAELNRYYARVAFYDPMRACYRYEFLQVEVHPQYLLDKDELGFNIGLITVNH